MGIAEDGNGGRSGRQVLLTAAEAEELDGKQQNDEKPYSEHTGRLNGQNRHHGGARMNIESMSWFKAISSLQNYLGVCRTKSRF